MVEQGFDLQLRFGEVPDARLTARLLARNRRVLCASPAYLRRAGEPSSPRELAQHACLFIREKRGNLRHLALAGRHPHETVKVRGPLPPTTGSACWAGRWKGTAS
jgi:DNA-binding transcriptional LysR family regulator